MASNEQYEQYMMLHRNFSETYSVVYRRVMDFYPLPQKFIQEAAPEVDSIVEDFWAHKSSPPENGSFRDLVFFAKSFKEFACNANNVFEEYKETHGQSSNYIKAIFRLREKNSVHNDEFIRLIPILNKLITNLEQVKLKTEHAANDLQKLQAEWTSIKQKINPG